MTLQSIQNIETRSPELYSLAFLLTGSTHRSLQAINRALNYHDEQTTLFGNFRNALARRLIIIEALEMMEIELQASRQRVARPTASERQTSKAWKSRPRVAREEFEKSVLEIDAFPRCAMLLTVFEGMSLQTAAGLLNADRSLTHAARRIGVLQLTDNLSRSSLGTQTGFRSLAQTPATTRTRHLTRADEGNTPRWLCKLTGTQARRVGQQSA